MTYDIKLWVLYPFHNYNSVYLFLSSRHFYSCFNIYWNNVTTLKWNSTSIYFFTLKHSFMITKLVFVDQLYIFKKNFMEWYLWNIFNVAFTVITCASTPCQHGACTDSPTGFVCACNSSYRGIRCDTGK